MERVDLNKATKSNVERKMLEKNRISAKSLNYNAE